RLIVRGSGPQYSSLVRLAAALGVEDLVRFIGRVSRERMVDLYNAATLVLSTSQNDLMPFALLEASACARPCVVTDAGAITDIVAQGCPAWMRGPRRAVPGWVRDAHPLRSRGRARCDVGTDPFAVSHVDGGSRSHRPQVAHGPDRV